MNYYELYLNGRLGNVLFELAHAYSEIKENQKLVVYATSQQVSFVRQLRDAFNLIYEIKYTSNDQIKKRFGGYYQSEKLFDVNKIRKLFIFNNRLQARAYSLLDELSVDPNKCVGMTVRRGDYVTLNGIWRVQPDEFYKESYFRFFDGMTCIASSDDIGYLKRMNIPNCVVIDDYTNDLMTILCVMSICRCHIGSSSTFSWWISWLNERKDSVNVFPDMWYDLSKLKPNQESPKEDIDQILPERWKRYHITTEIYQ